MSETAWSHLPNAAAIGTMIADVKVRSEVWRSGWLAAFSVARATSWYLARDAAREAAWAAVRSAAREAPWAAAREAAWAAARPAVWPALRNAVSALIAWPSSADMLSLTPDALRTIIDTCDGDVKHQAVLLLPAVIARSTT